MRPTTCIRPAVLQDCDRLMELATAAYGLYVERMDKKPAPMTEDYAARVMEKSVFILESRPARLEDGVTAVESQMVSSGSSVDSSTVMGFIVLIPQTDVLLLDNVAVDPAAQGRGYGKQLISFAEEQARKSGYTRIILYTNEVMMENVQLYLHLGYIETHRAMESGFNRVFFSKDLKEVDTGE